MSDSVMRCLLLVVLLSVVSFASQAQEFRPVPMPYYGPRNISTVYEFRVVLWDDSTFMTDTRIDVVEKGNHSITVKSKKDQWRFFPKDTKSISRITLEGKKLVGIPADSCWLFKAESGRINCYSFLAEPGMTHVIAIQDGEDAPIVPLTKENMLAIIGPEDARVYKLVQKGKLIKAVIEFNAAK